jgi:single-strand DNA-binding protein
MAANHVTLIGNLVDDPELRFTPSGVAMAKIRFAVNRRYQRNGEWQEETSFFGGTLWRDAAENAAESLTKGMRVIVTGRLEQRTWETQEGDKRSIVEISVDEIGPSLRWATASVTRSPRAADSFGGSEGSGPSVAAAPVARDDYGPDEAPF